MAAFLQFSLAHVEIVEKFDEARNTLNILIVMEQMTTEQFY